MVWTKRLRLLSSTKGGGIALESKVRQVYKKGNFGRPFSLAFNCILVISLIKSFKCLFNGINKKIPYLRYTVKHLKII